MAVAEGALTRNPAELLFVPREAPKPEKTAMTFEEVRLFFSAGLALVAGMRPGEIFALQRASFDKGYADIRQRIYRGQADSQKTQKSRRWAALGDGLATWIEQWPCLMPDQRAESWLFPSEKGITPLSKDNCWRRNFLPRLKPVGLGWANFQVVRRTHACLMDEIGAAPQVRADQMGHSVDVHQNEYTRASLDRRKKAVNELEKALGVM
jgi:integrase